MTNSENNPPPIQPKKRAAKRPALQPNKSRVKVKDGGSKKQNGHKRRGSGGREGPTSKKSKESVTRREDTRIEGDDGEGEGKCGYDHMKLDSYQSYDHPGYWGPNGKFEKDKCRNCKGKVKAIKGSSIKRCKGFDVCKLMWCGETECFAESRAMKAIMTTTGSGSGRTKRTARKVWNKSTVG